MNAISCKDCKLQYKIAKTRILRFQASKQRLCFFTHHFPIFLPLQTLKPVDKDLKENYYFVLGIE